jgi:outer membrane protein TolC
MRMSDRCVVFVVAIAMSAGALEAQAPMSPNAMEGQHERDAFRVEGPVLTLGQALEAARAANPDLAAVRARVDGLRERPAQMRSLAPPMLETTIWQWPVNSLNPANTNMYMFMVGQDLPGRGKRALRADVAQQDVGLALNDVDMRAQSVVADVRTAYADLVAARKAIALHLDTVDLLRQFADTAAGKYAATRASQQDALKPVVELSRLHADLIELDVQQRVAAAHLNTLMGRPLDAAIGPLDEPVEQALTASVSELQGLAADHEPSLQGARLGVDRAHTALTLAEHERKPDWNVQAGYMLLPHQTDGFLARLSVTWPTAPWAHGGTDARTREAAAGIDAATATQRSVEAGLRLSVQEAYLQVGSAQARAALLRTTLIPQAQQALDLSRVAYTADRGDVLSVLDAERSLLEAQVDYYRAVADIDRALAALERAVGVDLGPNYTHVVAQEPRS